MVSREESYISFSLVTESLPKVASHLPFQFRLIAQFQLGPSQIEIARLQFCSAAQNVFGPSAGAASHLQSPISHRDVFHVRLGCHVLSVNGPAYDQSPAVRAILWLPVGRRPGVSRSRLSLSPRVSSLAVPRLRVSSLTVT